MMADHGNDCYFFYYSSCANKDSCLFRHCKAAIGNNTVCRFWQEGRCFSVMCPYRHMEIPENVNIIPCFWENRPAGCTNPNCPFFHQKSQCDNDLKLTPVHPPVVINLADDSDSDSEEDNDDTLNFKMSTSPFWPAPFKPRDAGNFSPINVETISTSLPAKRKRLEEKHIEITNPKKAKCTLVSQKPSKIAAPLQTAAKGDFQVKTLEKIHRERAARLQLQQAAEDDFKKRSASKEGSSKRRLLLYRQKLPSRSDAGNFSPINVETISTSLPAKRKRLEEKHIESTNPKKAKCTLVSQKPSKIAAPPQTAAKGDFQVKTLEKIHRERAARLQLQQAAEDDFKKRSASKEGSSKRRLLLYRQKLPSRSDVPSNSFEEAGRPRGSIKARLGPKIPTTDVNGEHLPMKRSLARRLGGVVDMDIVFPSDPHQKKLQTIKERLSQFPGNVAPAQPADTRGAPWKLPAQISIKTLQELRREKDQRQSPKVPALSPTQRISLTRKSFAKPLKQNKRSSNDKQWPTNVQTNSKSLPAKRKRQEEKPIESTNPKKAKHTLVSQKPSKTAAPPQTAAKGDFKVKTLEEIHRERAASLDLLQAAEADFKKSSASKAGSSNRRLLPYRRKLPGRSKETGKVRPRKTAKKTAKPVKPAAAHLKTIDMVKVKSYEEIMREKRMRQQQEFNQRCSR